MNYWLMKSEPDVFSIDDLKKRPHSTEHWDGVRNYQARNFMKDGMKKGDLIFFYHSNCEEPGIVGLAKVVKEAYPDFTSWDKKSKYYDEKSTPEKPRWFMVDVKFQKKFKKTLTLKELKEQKPLKDFRLIQKGNRLSVIPVTERESRYLLKLAEE